MEAGMRIAVLLLAIFFACRSEDSIPTTTPAPATSDSAASTPVAPPASGVESLARPKVWSQRPLQLASTQIPATLQTAWQDGRLRYHITLKRNSELDRLRQNKGAVTVKLRNAEGVMIVDMKRALASFDLVVGTDTYQLEDWWGVSKENILQVSDWDIIAVERR
jgi:hypothetical protein